MNSHIAMGGVMRAAYDGIFFDLRDSIEQGVYRYKDFLPSESVLVKRYGCAHNTVRKAIGILARQGYVLPIHGKGVRVIYHSTPLITKKQSCFEPNGFFSLNDAARRQGFTSHTKVLHMEPIYVDSSFAAETGFEVGVELIHLERMRYCNGVPLECETNYFRSETVQGITKADAENSIYNYIFNVLGGKIATSTRVFTVERATERDLELLEMNGADYVAVVSSASYDGDGILCEVSISHLHPSVFSFSYAAIRSSLNNE
jgi:GntR family trehalose operon transcriptional repressor